MRTRKKIVKGYEATFKGKDGELMCDTDLLAKKYAKSASNVPERIGFGKACEIQLMAIAYLNLKKFYTKKKKEEKNES